MGSKKYIKATVNLIFVIALFILVVLLFPWVISYSAPFIAGWMIACIAAPLVRFLEKRIKIRRKAGSVVVIVAVIAVVVAIIYALISIIGSQIASFWEDMPDLWKSAEQEITSVGHKFDAFYQKLPVDIQNTIKDGGDQIGDSIGEFLTKISTPTIEALSNMAKQIPSILIAVIFALLSSYLFVSQRGEIEDWCRQYMPISVQKGYHILKKSFFVGVGGYFRAQLLIEIWIYFLLMIGLYIFGVKYSPLIALGIAVLDFLPLFGTGTVMWPWAIIKFLAGDIRMGIGLMVLWGIGQLVRQMIQPKIVGQSVGIKPIPTLVFLYLGYRLAGVMGMIFSVPLALVLMMLYQEGAFDTTKDSIRILVAGFNNFRRLSDEDLWEAEEQKVISEKEALLYAQETEEEVRRLREEHEQRKLEQKRLRQEKKEDRKKKMTSSGEKDTKEIDTSETDTDDKNTENAEESGN